MGKKYGCVQEKAHGMSLSWGNWWKQGRHMFLSGEIAAKYKKSAAQMSIPLCKIS